MKWTRLSLFYVAGYLFLTGLVLVAAPADGLRWLQAEHTYDPIFVRVSGSFMLALSALLVQIIRHRADALYTTTLLVRVMFLSVFAWTYRVTHDRVFLVVIGVVGLGFVLTLAAYIADRRSQSAGGIGVALAPPAR